MKYLPGDASQSEYAVWHVQTREHGSNRNSEVLPPFATGCEYPTWLVHVSSVVTVYYPPKPLWVDLFFLAIEKNIEQPASSWQKLPVLTPSRGAISSCVLRAARSDLGTCFWSFNGWNICRKPWKNPWVFPSNIWVSCKLSLRPTQWNLKLGKSVEIPEQSKWASKWENNPWMGDVPLPHVS